ncbi:TonB-dependent receptor [Pedobacter boryungensis]|uniref:TonB-dependent receptor n=1 Tax=Pedobacter boryungensis TaxID=869962 RepID=A0ABX2D8Z0_9SPHI|nr:TonB-dependent receptor [Pedobacter boryungensis]NQX30477.1 TonB-dependent receptor [Pedobacter boryungensis]
MKKSLLLKVVVIVFAFVGFTSVANAQITTSSMTGTIKDSKESLPGASVKATHTPTGTVYGVITNADGRYTIGNMRVGGPYTIEVSFVGYKPQRFDDVYLKLGEPFVLNVTLSDNSSTLATVNIIGTGTNAILNSNKSGANTVVSRAQIQTLPTISRSVNDITRLTPQSNSNNGIGGGNYRSNNFSVDGANYNNQFGIGANIPAGGSPISIDALEQISINVTPYDVRQTGFTGGSVNAVTRSGGNRFFGNAFYTMRGDDQQGRKIGDYTIQNLQKLDEKNYGASFGGPIIKDKLFFFVNYERKITKAPGTSRIAATPALPYGSISTVTKTTADFMNTVSSYLDAKYGYKTGPYQNYENISENEKFFARLDWNIAKNHRFSIRYNQVESQSPSPASTSVTGSAVAGSLGYGNVRSGNASTAGLPFFNSNYYQAANLYSATAELNSSFGNKVTNTLRVAYSHQNDPRNSDSAPFPLVDILDNTQTGTSAGNVLTTFGYEAFTYGNLRDVTSYTYSDDLSLALGKHNLTLGLQAEFSTTKNGFQRFGTGFYTFKSWDDFVNNARPLQYSVTYPLTADGSQAFPSFKFAQYSAYLQDEFNVSDRLKLTAGIRFEQATYPGVDEIKTHPLVAAQTFANGEKINTGELPENKMTYSPRFGFNWDVNGDRSLQVRGGTGIFTGRVPFVWIVSQSGDAGLIQYTQAYSGATTPFFNPSIAPNLVGPKGVAGTTIPSTISAMSKDLRFPSTWKSSLAVDAKLPWGIVGTLEGIYGKDLYSAVAVNVNLKDPTPLNIAGYPDNRPFFAATAFDKQAVPLTSGGLVAASSATTSNTLFNAIKMKNAKGGYNWSLTGQLSKQFSRGLGLMVAYTKSDQRNFGDGSGDQLLNLWSIPQTSSNPNVASLSYSSNLNPDRVIASVSYKKEYFKNLATSIALFYEGSQQGRFSYTYSADFNRDGQTNDLIYVPKDASEITFSGNVVIAATATTPAKTYTPQQQSDIFMAYIEQDDYLKTRKGQYAERNGAKSPWRNQVDFRLTQEVFKNVGNTKNSVQFSVDIFNVGNMLNKNWGNINFVNNAAILVPQNVTAINATTKPTFRMNTANGDIVRTTFGTSQTISSTFYMQFGLRYNFN